MALYLSPLVDVNEIDLTTTIPAVATAIGVIAIRQPYKGPEKKRQLITTIDELVGTFGEPTSASYKDVLAATGYLKYGGQLYCTAVRSPSATFAGAYGEIVSAGDWNAYQPGPSGAYRLDDFVSADPDKYGDEPIVFSPNRDDFLGKLSFIAKSTGRWGNYIKIAMVGKNVYDKIRKGKLTYTEIGISQEMMEDIDSVDVSFDSSSDTEFLVLVKTASQAESHRASPNYLLREAHLVSTDTTKLDDEGQNIYCENLINQNSLYVRCNLKSSAKQTNMNAVYTETYQRFGGGANSVLPSDPEIIEAYELYEDPETVDVNLFIDADKSTNVKETLVAICEDRKDSIAILDVPGEMAVNNTGNEVTDIRDFRLGISNTVNLNINSSYAALYGNWLEIFDKWAGKYRWIPSSGHVAGIFANTDDVSDPWYAPAGLNRAIITNIRRLAYNPNQASRDILYKVGVNPIVSFAGQGKVVWGQKTLLDKNSAFNRINVRRLFIILEKAIATAVKYFLFEPNDSFTRLQLVNMVEPFLRDVKSRRGIYDYLVICDSTNNSSERVDRNELWCDIYIKPTKSAEFIVLNFVATKTGASFTELVSATSTPTAGA